MIYLRRDTYLGSNQSGGKKIYRTVLIHSKKKNTEAILSNYYVKKSIQMSKIIRENGVQPNLVNPKLKLSAAIRSNRVSASEK
jgi:hypothetical protein